MHLTSGGSLQLEPTGISCYVHNAGQGTGTRNAIGSYRGYAIAIDGEAGDSLT